MQVSRFTCPDRISIGIEFVHAPNTPFSELMLPVPTSRSADRVYS
jgi:hypothetical protein